MKPQPSPPTPRQFIARPMARRLPKLFPCGATACGSGSGRGYSLTELLMVMVVAAVLAAVAYPSYQSHVLRSRRADAVARLLELQQAQERWRGGATTYATLAELGLQPTTPGGDYELRIEDASPGGYVLVATAIGRQTQDTHCATLRLTMTRGSTNMASGPNDAAANPPLLNKRCWNQ